MFNTKGFYPQVCVAPPQWPQQKVRNPSGAPAILCTPSQPRQLPPQGPSMQVGPPKDHRTPQTRSSGWRGNSPVEEAVAKLTKLQSEVRELKAEMLDGMKALSAKLDGIETKTGDIDSKGNRIIGHLRSSKGDMSHALMDIQRMVTESRQSTTGVDQDWLVSYFKDLSELISAVDRPSPRRARKTGKNGNIETSQCRRSLRTRGTKNYKI